MRVDVPTRIIILSLHRLKYTRASNLCSIIRFEVSHQNVIILAVLAARTTRLNPIIFHFKVLLLVFVFTISVVVHG